MWKGQKRYRTVQRIRSIGERRSFHVRAVLSIGLIIRIVSFCLVVACLLGWMGSMRITNRRLLRLHIYSCPYIRSMLVHWGHCCSWMVLTRLDHHTPTLSFLCGCKKRVPGTLNFLTMLGGDESCVPAFLWQDGVCHIHLTQRPGQIKSR